MPTGTLTPMLDLGALRLIISAGFTVEQIMRTDANGTAPIRVRADVLPHTTADALIIDDYEAAAGLVTYTIAGGAQRFSLSGQMTLDSPWLGVPIMQAYSQPIDTVLSYDADVAGRASVHEPLGREDSIVVLRKMGLRKGSLELWAGSHGRTKEILSALKRGEVMMLRQPEHTGMDMYFVAESASIGTLSTEDARSLFAVTVQYIEIARPNGLIASALGWDFSQLAASTTNFFTASLEYDDFQSMALDERTA